MSEFPLTPIGKHASVFSGFAFKSKDFSQTGIPVIKIKNVNNRQVNWTDTEFFPDSKVTIKHSKFLLLDRDVLIAMTGQGSVGRVGQIRINDGEQVLLNQRVGKFVTDPTYLNLAYLFYVISDPHYEQILFDAGSGSGQPNLSPSIIESVEIPLPPINDQSAIAHILGTLDDKIEINRRMNSTLEAMAQAIFKSWFVDFDPVRAKMEGRQHAGMDADTAALFPDRLVDSGTELGMIPEEWEARKLDSEFNTTMGQSPPGSTYNEEGIGLPFYQGRKDFGFRFPAMRIFCDAPTRIAEIGDTLISVRAPVGDINMAGARCCIGRGVAAVQHKTNASSYTYYFCRQLSSRLDHFEANGTVFGSINKADLNGMEILVPMPEVVSRFESLAMSLDDQIESNIKQSQTLASLRDTLLPRLMSGDLRVGEVEEMMEGV